MREFLNIIAVAWLQHRLFYTLPAERHSRADHNSHVGILRLIYHHDLGCSATSADDSCFSRIGL